MCLPGKMCRVYGYWGVNGGGCDNEESMVFRTVATAALALAGLVVAASAGFADGIEAGLWKITTRTASAGVIGPPHESSKCLSAEQTKDLGTTFSPVASTVNSECAPIERSLEGPLLNWHLVCKGQIDIELTGKFDFDTPHHYTGTVHTKAQMAGMITADTENMLEGQWVSACPR